MAQIIQAAFERDLVLQELGGYNLVLEDALDIVPVVRLATTEAMEQDLWNLEVR